jgi:CarD family transcriptional regulator
MIMSDQTTFKNGDKVVYPAHGVGAIVGEEVQAIGGTEIKVFVVAFEKDKMTLRVPVNRAFESGLRALSNEDKVKKAVTVLKGRAKPGRGMWSRRAQEYEAKINSGDILLISEVVRDLHKNVDDPDRSYSERVIYESALGRLAGEYAAVNSLDTSKAVDYIVDVLKSRKVTTAANEDNEVLEEAA